MAFTALAVLAVLVPVLAAGGASAVTLGSGAPRAWATPGTNPCGEVCDVRWALGRMRGVMPAQVHAALVRRLDAGDPLTSYEVATGDVILAMSYARAGIPYVDFAERVAQFPPDVRYSARGHAVTHGDHLYRFVRIAACGNWALILDRAAAPALSGWRPGGPVPLALPGTGGAIMGSTVGAGSVAGGARGFLGGGEPQGRGGPTGGQIGGPGNGTVLVETPAPVPLPGGLALLAAALTVLGVSRLRGGALPPH